MMQRIDTSKLISLLLTRQQAPQLAVILSDNPIFLQIARKKLRSEFSLSPKFFSGPKALTLSIEHINSGSLFSHPEPCLVEISEKITAKQWKEEKKNLCFLPKPLPASIYIFGLTAQRTVLKEDDFKAWGKSYLCYSPNAQDLLQCLRILLERHPELAKKNLQEKEKIVHLAVETYAEDLVSCDAHFMRMAEGKLSFADALAGNPNINCFHVVDALVKKDRHLLALRLLQCQANGEQASSVLMAIISFLKQFVSLQAELETGADFRTACENALIPFPAQGRLLQATKTLQKEQVILFLLTSPLLEMQMRVQKSPYSWLATELNSWISGKETGDDL